MFDELRETADDEPALEIGARPKRKAAGPEPRIFGMTAGQRLVLSILFFATVFVLGLSCLLITQRLWLT